MATADDANSAARVRLWVAERAVSLGVPLSVAVLCDTAVERLGVSGVTQTIQLTKGWPQTVHATDDLGVRIAELHVTVGEGPCLDVWREGGPVLVPQLDAPSVQRRWPLFTPTAVEYGVTAIFALPMAVGAIRVGVLTLHLTRSLRFDPALLPEALAFAHLGLQLHLDSRVGREEAEPSAPQLYGAQVHQATGMVSAQLEVDMDEAFNRLRARAFADDRTLTELAADVVSRRLRFDPKDEA